jgi:hypothetical protein
METTSYEGGEGVKSKLLARDTELILLALWVGVWIWGGRYYYRDDALIHLRYADMLREHCFLTFDGVHRSYGTSSILYVALLAAVGGIVHSVFLPKVFSIIGYVALLGLTLRKALKTIGIAQNLWFLFLVVLASPMAIRWFTDGMETSLVTAFALVLGYSTLPDPTFSVSPVRFAVPMLLALICVFIRVDMFLPLAFIGFGNAAYYLATTVHASRRRALVRAISGEIPLAAGGALALLGTWLLTGQIIPDSAIAKAFGFGFQPPILYALSVGRVFAASLSLGIGTLLVWVSSAALAWVHSGRALHWALVGINMALPVELFAAMCRGQSLQGMRYFLPGVAVMVGWNLAFLEKCWRSEASLRQPENPQRFNPRRWPLIIRCFVLFMLCEWVFEGHIVRRIMHSHAVSLQQMRSQHLEVFAGQRGIAGDIGFISYFTGASICDQEGLVNGTQFARVGGLERAKRCSETSPVFAFVDNEQRDELLPWINLKSWSVCHVYEFNNAFYPDPHFLLVRPDFAQLDCPKEDSAGVLR